MEYYGAPDEYSASQLMWRSTGTVGSARCWFKDEAARDFPAPHTDFLEQSIDYKVPLEMYSKLAEYDGSVIAERTKAASAACR